MTNKVNIILTHKCNLNCIHCYLDATIQSKEDLQINYELAIKTIDLLHDNGITHILFTGGECTIFPKITELVKYAKSLNIFVEIFTNGMILNKELFEIVDKINVSIDGTKEIHNHIRNNQYSFKNLIKVLDYLKEIDKNTNIQITLNNKNFQELEPLSKLFINYLNIRSVKLVNVKIEGRATNLDLLPAESDKILNVISTLYENTKYHIQFITDYMLNNEFVNYYLKGNTSLPLWIDIPKKVFYLYDEEYFKNDIEDFNYNTINTKMQQANKSINDYYINHCKTKKMIEVSSLIDNALKGEQNDR